MARQEDEALLESLGESTVYTGDCTFVQIFTTPGSGFRQFVTATGITTPLLLDLRYRRLEWFTETVGAEDTSAFFRFC